MLVCRTTLRGPQPSPTFPAGAITINPGDNIQTAINANGNGQAFRLAKGVHTISASLAPKTGNSFTGELGAVLDGTGWSSADNDDAVFKAVNNGITDVTIRNLVLRKGPQYGVNAYLTAARWLVDYCEIHHFKNGISLGVDGVVSNNLIHHNVGIIDDPNPALRGGGYTFNSALRAKMVNNEIAYNGQEQKFIYGTTNEPSRDLYIADNYVHHNVKDGIWIDGHGTDSIIERNLCEFNGRQGIVVEIGTTVTVRLNTIRGGNEGEALLISASRNCLVERNVVIDGPIGIGLFLDFTRLAESYPFWTVELQDNVIQSNDVYVGPGQLAANLSFQSAGDQTPYINNTKNNHFRHNRYFAPDTSSNWFVWNGSKSFTTWQGLPQDATGSIAVR